MTRRRNVFLIGRQPGAEDQLTEMLVWLAETVPQVRTALVELALGLTDVVPDEVEVVTQHAIVSGRLDAYLTGPGFALVVESKLGSEYGQGQIRKYLEWLTADGNDETVRGLMTLTPRPAPWDAEDSAYALERKIRGRDRRWEELHELLEPVAASRGDDPLAERLVREFLEMLSEEGLIPLQPLTDNELGGAWSEAWTLVRRYREFFHGSKGRIAEVIGAEALSNSWSDRGDWFWQDFRFEDGVRLTVGLLDTDEYERLPPGTHTKAPILWLAVKAEHLPEWDSATRWLEGHPPQGWRPGNRWYGRPTVWRYLAEAIGAGTFNEQRDRLASAAEVGRTWLEGGRASVNKHNGGLEAANANRQNEEDD